MSSESTGQCQVSLHTNHSVIENMQFIISVKNKELNLFYIGDPRSNANTSLF